VTVTQFQERTFDWRPRHDPKSRNYPIRALMPPGVTVYRTRAEWQPGPVLDQGSEGACVGFGWTQEALMSPVRVSVADMANRLWIGGGGNSVAAAIYHDARREDEWPGEEYEGTSVLAGAKVMSRLGYLREYRWCFGITDVVDTLILHGPVVLGINWLEGMYWPDMYGEVMPTGPVVGGHCIVASGYHPAKLVHPSSGRPARPMIQLTNSWGPDWGQNGQAWIEVGQLANLLDDGGEACVPVHRSYGRSTKPQGAIA
jgi:hypothetical protein